MTPLTKWNSAFVDIERGIAVFDGLAIEADSISDPRWDRVLPVMAEEQIFMCRMMTPLLESMPADSRVLDVGTGSSGVFAIQSARLGRPTVAIDIVPRASRYARYNARKHGISLVKGDPGPGQLHVLTQDFLTFKEEKKPEKFDVILIDPPFNPTCDGFEPAVHAKAGPLGQDCFDQWLPKASDLLEAGGCCSGIHMMLVNPDGSLVCESLVEECFKNAAFSYQLVMEPFPIRNFLEGMYVSFWSKPHVHDYIGRAPNQKFALVYFEIRTPKSSVTTNGSWTRLDAGAVPREISWQKHRIPLHRKIIENSSHEHSIPAPALFMRNHFGTEDISNHQETQEDSTTEHSRTPMDLIDRWIRHQGAIGDDSDSEVFRWLLIDTAPWYPTARGRQQLVSETSLWGLREKLARHGAHILGTYAQNTRSLHRTGIAPFLHPHFTGAQESITWRGIHFSVNHSSPNAKTSESDNSAFNPLVDEMVERLREKYDPPPKSPPVSDNGSFVSIARNLVELDVGHIVDYERKREPWLQKIKKHPDYGLSFDSGISPDAIGLELRHQAMHRRLDQILLPDLPSAGATSYFLGFPVTFRSVASEENDQSDGLPASYRGGVWVYAITHGDWTPERERFMFDLAKLLSMVFEMEYTALISFLSLRRSCN